MKYIKAAEVKCPICGAQAVLEVTMDHGHRCVVVFRPVDDPRDLEPIAVPQYQESERHWKCNADPEHEIPEWMYLNDLLNGWVQFSSEAEWEELQ